MIPLMNDQRLQHGGIHLERSGPEIEMETFLIAVKENQRHQESNRLTQDRGESGAGDPPFENRHEQQVEHHIHKGRHHDELERTDRIAHSPQDRRDHIIAVNEQQTAAADQEIMIRAQKSIFGSLHQMQEGIGKNH